MEQRYVNILFFFSFLFFSVAGCTKGVELEGHEQKLYYLDFCWVHLTTPKYKTVTVDDHSFLGSMRPWLNEQT